MGQYWVLVNLDKKEFVDPRQVGSGLKLIEILTNHPSACEAMVVLCAAQREVRGGGDLDMEKNRHGPERDFCDLPEEYREIARRTIGRWAGDRVVLVGDYTQDSDLPDHPHASTIWDACRTGEYRNISQDVARVLAHEIHPHAKATWQQEHSIPTKQQKEYEQIIDDLRSIIAALQKRIRELEALKATTP